MLYLCSFDIVGTETLGVVVEQLLNIFEIPPHTSGLACLGLEDIKNSFVVFKVSGLCADVWREMTQEYTREQNKNGQRPVDIQDNGLSIIPWCTHSSCR